MILRSLNNHETIVGPTSKFHLALLIVKREPGDIDFASAFEDAWRYVVAGPIMSNNNVRLERIVKSFVSAENVGKYNEKKDNEFIN